MPVARPKGSRQVGLRGEQPLSVFLEQIGKMWASEPAWTADQLAAIQVPTTIVLGDHDEAITREHTEYLAKTIPGAKLVILPGVSRFAMLQDPAGYTKPVREFIDAT